MKALAGGENIALGAAKVEVSLDWQPTKIGGCEVDVAAFLLTGSGKVRGDADFIFYNQPRGADGQIALTVSGARHCFSVNTTLLPAEVERIAFAATIYGEASFAAAQRLTISVSDTASFTPELAGRSEKALIVGELYKRNGQWKFRAVGQGFNGGLGPLATSFGVDISDPTPPPATPELKPEPVAPPPPASAVNLSKITLQKRGDSKAISLKKEDKAREIVINLNWDAKVKQEGFFSGLFGNGGQEIDLDLGVFYELRDGRRSVIDGLQFSHGQGGPRDQQTRQGCYTRLPYIWHTGDDLSGAGEGENILVNPLGFAELKRLVIYCFIYDGVAQWSKTNAVVSVRVPGNPEIVVEMGNEENRHQHCVIASIDFLSDSEMQVTKHVTFHSGHADSDKAYQWGLSWKAGSK